MYVASSVSSLWNFKREGISEESVLKRYALLYDTIIFNRRGCPIADKGLNIANNVAEMVSLLICKGDNLTERKALGRNKEFQKLFVDCWDIVENPEKFERDRFSVINNDAGNDISQFCQNEIRKQNNLPNNPFAYDIDDVKELAGDIYADLGMNTLLQMEGVELIPCFSPLVGRALQGELEKSGFPCHDLFRDNLTVPDFDQLTWDEIFELRTDKHIKNFRRTMFSLGVDQRGVDFALLEKIQTDLWQLAADVRPNIGKGILSGILSNLPSPLIINPFGLAAAGKDYIYQKKLEEKYGHVFFVQKLKGDA